MRRRRAWLRLDRTRIVGAELAAVRRSATVVRATPHDGAIFHDAAGGDRGIRSLRALCREGAHRAARACAALAGETLHARLGGIPSRCASLPLSLLLRPHASVRTHAPRVQFGSIAAVIVLQYVFRFLCAVSALGPATVNVQAPARHAIASSTACTPPNSTTPCSRASRASSPRRRCSASTSLARTSQASRRRTRTCTRTRRRRRRAWAARKRWSTSTVRVARDWAAAPLRVESSLEPHARTFWLSPGLRAVASCRRHPC